MTKEETIDKKEILSKITPVIEKFASQSGLILLEVNFVKESGRWHLRIFIYNQEHPISHEDCENLTKNIDESLDSFIPVQYCLEVSSPGIERKLKSVKEYNIFRDKKVEIKLKQQEGPKCFLAKIIEYSQENGLKIQVIDTNEIMNLSEKNISSIKLKTEYEIK
ncbi:MAG: hypothetical protein V2B14_02750 [bacterium]